MFEGWNVRKAQSVSRVFSLPCFCSCSEGECGHVVWDSLHLVQNVLNLLIFFPGVLPPPPRCIIACQKQILYSSGCRASLRIVKEKHIYLFFKNLITMMACLPSWICYRHQWINVRWCLGQCLMCNKLLVAVSCYIAFIFVVVIIITKTMMTLQHSKSLVICIAFVDTNASRIYGLLCLQPLLTVLSLLDYGPACFLSGFPLPRMKVSGTVCFLGMEDT